jgi:spermidine/putrescine transport system substrate-binding protein
MMHIRRVSILLFVLLIGSLSVSAAPNDQTSFWTCPSDFAGQTLNVYNWTTYIAEDTISNFERICGVDVVYNTYASDSDMLEELRQGNPGYDVVVPTNSTVYLMVEEGLLQRLDFNHLPNYRNIADQFHNPPHDPDNAYTVPYQWGTIGVGYNRTAVGHDITSWDDVFNYDGPVAWLDEYRVMLGFALLMLGDDPNTADVDEVNEAGQYLFNHSENVAEIAPDTGQDLLASGDVDIAIEYSGDIFQLIASCECDDYRYVIPQEGAQIWTDSLAIPTGAPNKRLAEQFIDYILYAQVGADIANYTAYASPNQTAISEGLINDEYLTNSAIYPPDDIIANLFYNVSSAELEQTYSGVWDGLRSALGR